MTTAQILKWMPVIIQILTIIIENLDDDDTGFDDPAVL